LRCRHAASSGCRQSLPRRPQRWWRHSISSTGRLAQRYREVCQRFGGVDLIVFCAADYHPERSWQISAEGAAHTLAVNLGSVYTGLATVLPDMLARGSGGIAIVASVAGYIGLPNATVYGPSKAALINLAELLYADLRPRGLGCI
jgi:short-subunit dehydrogenase